MNGKEIYAYLVSSGLTPAGACGLMGNLYAESGLKFNVLERLCIQRYKERGIVYTDESYTTAVDSGAITRAEFLNPMGKKYGYGICQWTSEGRKAGLYDGAKIEGVSIGDPELQMEYLVCELKTNYQSVRKVLTTTNSVREASDIVLKRFESPADQSESVQKLRAGYGQKYYEQFAEVKNMAVLIGSARSNERGGINGGKAGDQTGGEVSTQNWYLHGKGWKVIRPIDKAVADKIARNMEAACANDNIGYCQDHRDTVITAAKPYGYDAAKVDKPVEADCSSTVRLCCLYAGIKTGDFYTGNESEVLAATGEFLVLEGDKYCKSSDYLERGDILVTKTKGHTVVVLSDGSKVTKEGWKQAADGKRWWYQYADGTYPAGEFAYLQEVTGGTFGWYLFDAEGYMLTGHQTAPDGRQYYLCEEPGINEGKCMVTDDQGALQIADWDKEKNRYAI